MLQHALSLVQGAAWLSHEVTRMTKLDAGEVRFGSDAVAAVNLVPQAMARFITAYPKVRSVLQVDNWERLGRSLSREEIEFFIADVRHFEADPNFQTQALTPRRSVFFCRAGHPLLAKDSLSTNDLFDYPLATPLIAPGIRKLLANLSGRIDFAPAIELEQFAALASHRAPVRHHRPGRRRSLRRPLGQRRIERAALAQRASCLGKPEQPLRGDQPRWGSLVACGEGIDRNAAGGGKPSRLARANVPKSLKRTPISAMTLCATLAVIWRM